MQTAFLIPDRPRLVIQKDLDEFGPVWVGEDEGVATQAKLTRVNSVKNVL